MKICILTNHFYPEDFKVNDIAFALAAKGNEVTVLTAVPDYPYGKFYRGYSFFKKNREIISGVKVVRLPRIPRGRGGAFKLGMNYLSYYLSLSFYIRLHSLKNEYDAIFVHMTSPFFLGLPAVWLKKRKGIPLLFWVLDLWPESVISAGNIQTKIILRPLERMVKMVYSNCDTILVGSEGFTKSICSKGSFASKISYFPNWAEEIKDAKPPEIEPFFKGVDDFVFMFAGNMGEAQNLDCLIKAANRFKTNKNIKFIFVGDGRKKTSLEDLSESLELAETCLFTGRYPLEVMPYLMNEADVLVVSLKDEEIFNLTVPAKLQFYMAQGKPILAVLNGDGAEIISNANCGISIPSGQIDKIEQAIQSFVTMDCNELKEKGANGKLYYEEHFRKELRLSQLEKMLSEVNKS